MSDIRRLLVIICVAVWCLVSLPFAHAQQCGEDQLAANTIIIQKKAAAVSASAENGVVGYYNSYGDQELLNSANTEAIFDIATVVTAGTISYGHIYCGALAAAGKTICLSMQENSDGGTVRLSGTGVSTGASRWLNIAMGGSYTVSMGQTYRLVAQIASSALYVGWSGAYGSDSIRRDASFAYSCGASVTDDSEFYPRHLMIVFDNQSGDP